MAYPTTLAFLPTSPSYAGVPPFNDVSTTQKCPLGTRMRFQDPTYGEIECIYLKGVASTAAGDVVSYDPKNAATVRAVAATRGPLAVAMAATVASNYGWYAVQGVVPVNSASAGTGAANSGLATTSTAGQVTVRTAANQGIDGVLCKSAQDGPGAGFTDVLLSYPCANGLT